MEYPARMNHQDDTPFGTQSGDFAAGLAQVAVGAAGGEIARHAVQGKAHQAFRARVLAWATERGFSVADSNLVRETDGVRVEIALFEITDATAIVRSRSIRTASKLSLSLSPKTWRHRLLERFSRPIETGDQTFDAKWHVRANDANAAKQLLDEPSREALRDLAAVAWCLASYEVGALEVRVDVDQLAGRHLLLAARVLVALACADVRSSAYR